MTPIVASFGGISKRAYFPGRVFVFGDRDEAFSTNIGTGPGYGYIYASAIQSDGKIIVSGDFSTWNGVGVNNIVRLNSDGTRDTTFSSNISTGPDGNVTTIAIQSDGKILVGGGFVTWNSVTVNYIVRLNSDGTRDTGFTTNVGTGPSGNTIRIITIQSDGKILVCGVFTAWNGVTAYYIVRLNSDGTRETTFTTNIGTGPNNPTFSINIASIGIQSDGKIIVGGAFTTWNGVSVNYIVRLNSNGTRDTTFTTNVGTGPDAPIYTIRIQSDNKILVGGDFPAWNGTTVNGIVRLNSNGTRDTAFTSNTGTGADSTVWVSAIQSDGKILVGGGGFSTWNGVTVGKIICLNSDGTRNTAFSTNIGTGPSSQVETISIQSDGKIILGGSFETWNDTTVYGIVRLFVV